MFISQLSWIGTNGISVILVHILQVVFVTVLLFNNNVFNQYCKLQFHRELILQKIECIIVNIQVSEYLHLPESHIVGRVPCDQSLEVIKHVIVVRKI